MANLSLSHRVRQGGGGKDLVDRMLFRGDRVVGAEHDLASAGLPGIFFIHDSRSWPLPAHQGDIAGVPKALGAPRDSPQARATGFRRERQFARTIACRGARPARQICPRDQGNAGSPTNRAGLPGHVHTKIVFRFAAPLASIPLIDLELAGPFLPCAHCGPILDVAQVVALSQPAPTVDDGLKIRWS
jgi:hypothetical protein